MLDMAATSTSGIAFSYPYVGHRLFVHVQQKGQSDVCGLRSRALELDPNHPSAGNNLEKLQKEGSEAEAAASTIET